MTARRTLLGMVWLLCACGAARADASCTALFERLAAATAGGGQSVHALWSTTYHVPSRDARFLGQTQIDLENKGGDLVGEGTRHQIVFSQSAGASAQTDSVVLRIRRDGKIMFNERYGPYDPSCSGGTFAVVLSGDSVEAFSFGSKTMSVAKRRALRVADPKNADEVAKALASRYTP